MDNKQNFRKLIYLLLFGFSCSLLTIYIYIDYIQKKSIDNIILQTKTPHNLIKNEINVYKDKKLRIMTMLDEHRYMRSFVKNESKKYELEELFYSIVKSDRDYMQLRFIDVNGMEKIRVDQNRYGDVKVIEKDKLQDKSARDYVKSFMNLKKDEIAFSKFDLNIENGKVEIPFNPTLRIGYKVFNAEELKGLIVINIFMQKWIDEIFSINSFKIAVIDENNYYKSHYNKDLSWGKYRDTPKKVKDIPKWQNLNNDYHILNDHTIGRVLNLFSENVLVLYKMPRNMKTVLIESIASLLVALFISFIFIMVPIALIIYKYINMIKTSEEYQKNIFNNMFDAIFIIDNKAKIQELNKQAIKLFGYEHKDLIGTNINRLVSESNNRVNSSFLMKYYNRYGESLESKNVELICKDNLTIPITLAVTKMKIERKELFIVIVRDLREIRALERENKKQENILQHQAKLASMGEMIGAIAHQWRQPLNELSIRIQNIKYAFMKEEIDEDYIKTFINKNKTTISFMSNTIDDFRDFFRIDKEKNDFEVKGAIEAVINMQSAQLKEYNISIDIDGKEILYNGFKTEFQQVILNLINNAKDALVENKIVEPKIVITIKDSEVSIKDNAGGISDDILQRVFEPYFTTKEQGKGTGMGLYMSKMIIEDNMEAKLVVRNNKDGAEFIIVL